MPKKFDEKYIEDAKQRLKCVMYEKPGPKDWTEVSVSIRDAVLAAATIYDHFTDEQVHKLNTFLNELVVNYYLPRKK